MRKIVIHSPGGYGKLKLEEHADLRPSDDQVIVDTVAIGVNYADCIVRWGVYDSAKKYVGWPITPGFEFSGTVSAVGSQVKDIAIGTPVMGLTRFNAYASQVAVTPQQLFTVPQRFSLEQAAAFPTVHLTAYHALYQNMRLRPGMNILIHSAAGGVGSAAVQLAKLADCHVTGVVGSSHKAEYVRELGADVVIDKSRDDLWPAAERAVPQGFDAVMDANGHETLWQSYRHLRPTGKLFTYGFHTMLPRGRGTLDYWRLLVGWVTMPRFNPLNLTSDNKGVIGFNLSFLFDRFDLLGEGMTQLIDWANQGKLRPPMVKAFPLEQVADAHRMIESGQSVGKIVLVL